MYFCALHFIIFLFKNFVITDSFFYMASSVIVVWFSSPGLEKCMTETGKTLKIISTISNIYQQNNQDTVHDIQSSLVNPKSATGPTHICNNLIPNICKS